MGQLIEVNVEGYGNSLAKIVETFDNENYLIKYLSPYKDSGKLYKYEKKGYEIEPEMVAYYYETDDIGELGYTQVERNLFEKDPESDYEPSTEDEDESEDEECVNSDEEFVDGD
tara:strand:+ start:426 stop:767 length:342 start_codon:yes stop_codon:yes gene_type:complete